MKFRYRLIFFAIGLLGIGLMIWQTDFSQVQWNKLVEPMALLLFAGIIGIWVVIYFLHALAYKVILGEDSKKVKMHSMFRICAAGFALNSVTPAGLVGGEPYRIMALRRYVPTARAASSTLTFSIFYALGHCMLWVTGTLLYIIYGCPGPLWVTITIIVAGTLLLGILVVSFIFKNMGFVYPFMRFLAKIPLIRRKLKPAVEKNKESYIEIDNNIRDFRSQGWRYFAVMGIEFFTRLLEALEYFLLLLFFTQGTTPVVNFFDGLLIMSTASLVGNILFFIPMQAGSRELGTQIALSFLGVNTGVFAQMAIVYRLRELVFIALGIILVLTGRKYKSREQIEEEEKAIQDALDGQVDGELPQIKEKKKEAVRQAKKLEEEATE